VYLAAVVLRDDGRGGLQQQAHAGQVAVHGGVVQRGVAGAVGLLEQRVALEVQHQAQAVAVPRGGAQVQHGLLGRRGVVWEVRRDVYMCVEGGRVWWKGREERVVSTLDNWVGEGVCTHLVQVVDTEDVCPVGEQQVEEPRVADRRRHVQRRLPLW
jgi:hypothetical protein